MQSDAAPEVATLLDGSPISGTLISLRSDLSSRAVRLLCHAALASMSPYPTTHVITDIPTTQTPPPTMQDR